MKKIISVNIDEDLHKKAKEMGIGISAFVNIKLREYIALIEGKGASYGGNPPPEPLINKNPLQESRARSPARTGRQPPKL